MKNYVSTIPVSAEEMKEKTWNEINKHLLYASKQNNDNQEGYHIIYEDGSQTWLPKNCFEKIFKESV